LKKVNTPGQTVALEVAVFVLRIEMHVYGNQRPIITEMIAILIPNVKVAVLMDVCARKIATFVTTGYVALAKISIQDHYVMHALLMLLSRRQINPVSATLVSFSKRPLTPVKTVLHHVQRVQKTTQVATKTVLLVTMASSNGVALELAWMPVQLERLRMALLMNVIGPLIQNQFSI
jgi:hypothetical protein